MMLTLTICLLGLLLSKLPITQPVTVLFRVMKTRLRRLLGGPGTLLVSTTLHCLISDEDEDDLDDEGEDDSEGRRQLSTV
ncbi:hypothetical protein OIU76_017962 [Salix suchowensis]|nr:hypothetical protein OIU77_005032 [Salix suchowensis]KAJ6296484.1 hypothetical protein OIU78_024352 [Salix suchowensis]KAJ6308285.1 hypothetical protein OIU76_017962 [Salix suchowensis]